MRVKTSRENKKKLRVEIQNRKYKIEKSYRSHYSQRYEVNPNRNQTSIKRESEKNKKFFSIAAPTANLRKRGRGYESKM